MQSLVTSAAAAAASMSASGPKTCRDLPNFRFKRGDLTVIMFDRIPSYIPVLDAVCDKMRCHARVLPHPSVFPPIPTHAEHMGLLTDKFTDGRLVLVWDPSIESFVTPWMRDLIGLPTTDLHPTIVRAGFGLAMNRVVSEFLVYGLSSGEPVPLLNHLAEIVGSREIQSLLPALRNHTVCFMAQHFPGLLVQSGIDHIDAPHALMPRLHKQRTIPRLFTIDSEYGDSGEPFVTTMCFASVQECMSVTGVVDNAGLYSMRGRVQFALFPRTPVGEMNVANFACYRVGSLLGDGAMVVMPLIAPSNPSAIWQSIRLFQHAGWDRVQAGSIIDIGDDDDEVVSQASMSRVLRWIGGFIYKHNVPVPSSTYQVPLWTRVVALCSDRKNSTFVARNFQETPAEAAEWEARVHDGVWNPFRYKDCYTRIIANVAYVGAVQRHVDAALRAIDSAMAASGGRGGSDDWPRVKSEKACSVRVVKDALVVDLLFSLLPIEQSVEFENDTYAHALWYAGTAQRHYRRATRIIFHPLNHHAFFIFPDCIRVARRTALIADVLLLHTTQLKRSVVQGARAFMVRYYARYIKALTVAGLLWYVTTCDREMATVVDVPCDMLAAGAFVACYARSFHTMGRSLRFGASDVYEEGEDVLGGGPSDRFVTLQFPCPGPVPTNECIPDVEFALSDCDLCSRLNGGVGVRSVADIARFGIPTVFTRGRPLRSSYPPFSIRRKRKSSSSSDVAAKKHTSGVCVVSPSLKRDRDDDDDDDAMVGGVDGLDEDDVEPVTKKLRVGLHDDVFVRVMGGEIVRVPMHLIDNEHVRQTALWRVMTGEEDDELSDAFSLSDPLNLLMITHQDLLFFLCVEVGKCFLRCYLELGSCVGASELVRRMHAQNFMGSSPGMTAVALALAGIGRVDLVPAEITCLLSVSVKPWCNGAVVTRVSDWVVSKRCASAFAVMPMFPAVHGVPLTRADGTWHLKIRMTEFLVLDRPIDYMVSMTVSPNKTMSASSELQVAMARGPEVIDAFFTHIGELAVHPTAPVGCRVIAELRGAFNVVAENKPTTIMSLFHVLIYNIIPKDSDTWVYAIRALHAALVQVVPSAAMRSEMFVRAEKTSHLFPYFDFLPVSDPSNISIAGTLLLMSRSGASTQQISEARVTHVVLAGGRVDADELLRRGYSDLGEYNYAMRQLFL